MEKNLLLKAGKANLAKSLEIEENRNNILFSTQTGNQFLVDHHKLFNGKIVVKVIWANTSKNILLALALALVLA